MALKPYTDALDMVFVAAAESEHSTAYTELLKANGARAFLWPPSFDHYGASHRCPVYATLIRRIALLLSQCSDLH